MKFLSLLSLALLLAAPTFADQRALQTAIAGKHRSPAWVERDQFRHPLQTLTLFDVQPHHTVVEIWPGGGWYTEILAPYLRDDGLLIAAHYDSDDTQADYRPNSRKTFEQKLAADRSVYGKVRVTSLMIDESNGSITKPAAPPNSADRVLTFRNAHGWHARGITDAVFGHFFEILKPGGKLGIVQHMADPGQDWLTHNIGYVGRDYIIDRAVKAGFRLEAEGFFNMNPMDNKRYNAGVWQLPPTLRNLETADEKAPYLNIGESERMTLLFVKP